MADGIPFALDPSAITSIQDCDVNPSPLRRSETLSHPRRLPAKALSTNGKPGRGLQPGHRRFSGTVDKPLPNAIIHARLFQDLSSSELNEIVGAGQEQAFSHSQQLFGEGDALRSVSIITSGHAKIVRHSSAGKLMLLHVCGAGDVLDGLGCSSGSRHFVGAHAMRQCRVLSWDVQHFESLTMHFSALGRNALRILHERSRALEGRVHELATDRVPQRLAKVLVRLILQLRGSARPNLTGLTNEDLAQMAGTTQFTVSRLLCDWAAQRIIEAERTAILVENLPGLISIATEIDETNLSAVSKFRGRRLRKS